MIPGVNIIKHDKLECLSQQFFQTKNRSTLEVIILALKYSISQKKDQHSSLSFKGTK
jgi:hypothetical protein